MSQRTNTIAFRERREAPSLPLPHECVLILTPLGRDAAYTDHVLRKAGLRSEICDDLSGLCDLIHDEIGVLLIAEEALTNTEALRLIELLNAQPAWSDIPIVVFTSGNETQDATARVLRLFHQSGNVTLLERPVHAITLVSSIQVALRARRRQWQIRELLEQRAQLLTEARAARDEAERANRTKDQFLATLSHELRTPLNAILGWTQVLSSPEVQPADVQRGVETIARNAHTQAQLIEDLLDVSRIVSGKLRLNLQQTDIQRVLQAAIAAVAPARASRGVTLQYEPSGELPTIVADPERLLQIVSNLLSNAIKFSKPGGTVRLIAKEEGHSVRITVEDTGIGISSEFLPYVFDRFRQADGSSTRRQGGLGLGLSIVKQLVSMLGGTVSVHSDGVGKGARFTVILPISPAESTDDKRGDGGQTTGRSNTDLSGMKILVVDDEPDARNVLERILLDRNAHVRVADSVTRALALIDEARPDVIISDISMPERDGFDLLHEIRTDGHNARDIPVIALTAYARSEDRDRIKGAGFSAHVAKPLVTDALLAALRTVK